MKTQLILDMILVNMVNPPYLVVSPDKGQNAEHIFEQTICQ